MRVRIPLAAQINLHKTTIDTFNAIDLFAGIRFIKIGFEKTFKDKISFVFLSKKYKLIQQTYYEKIPNGYITKIHEFNIAIHAILIARFFVRLLVL